MEEGGVMDLELIVKDPLARGPLALYPLYSPSPAAPAYLTGPEAERMGVLHVDEKQGLATVPELAVQNRGALPLLLLEGETLVGAKQNRTLDLTVLVPAGATVAAPVSCVEAGRWGAPRASSRSPRHAPSDLRRVKTSALASDDRRGLKQAQVWDRVAQYQHDLAAPSATGALEDAFATRDADVQRLVHGTSPLPDQRGVLVAVGGVARNLDVFDKAETLAAYWDGLTAGYALDAVGVPTTEAPSVSAIEQLVVKLRAAQTTATPSAGLGRTSMLVGDGVVGHTLEWGGAHVHTSVFFGQTSPAPRATSRGRTRPIRRRGWTT
jgi:hypothetical protein